MRPCQAGEIKDGSVCHLAGDQIAKAGDGALIQKAEGNGVASLGCRGSGVGGFAEIEGAEAGAKALEGCVFSQETFQGGINHFKEDQLLAIDEVDVPLEFHPRHVGGVAAFQVGQQDGAAIAHQLIGEGVEFFIGIEGHIADLIHGSGLSGEGGAHR